MRCRTRWFYLVVVMVCAAGSMGCNRAGAPPAADAPKADVAIKHNHGAPGPHGGPRPTLGNHEYHAELTHDESSGEVAVYITDGQYKQVSVPEQELYLTVAVAGKPKEFVLVNDAKQKATPAAETRFVLVDKLLAGAIGDKANVQMNATIKGKPYAAAFAAASQAHDDDDDDDHGHAHDEKPGDHAGH
jgi:hypothetical protein